MSTAAVWGLHCRGEKPGVLWSAPYSKALQLGMDSQRASHSATLLSCSSTPVLWPLMHAGLTRA